MESGVKPGEDWIPLCVPQIDGAEWTYVKECLDTGWVSSVGAFVERFEAKMARAVGRTYAVATVNGTAALHTALLVAGVEAGDEVVVSDLTFIAPVNAIRYVGAHPVFVDAESAHWQMDVDKLEHFLLRMCTRTSSGLRNTATGRRVAAIVPVHILGSVCDVDVILRLAESVGVPVIEDATEALGATYRARPAGAFGALACFSFNGNKILTTGGGGMLVTDDPHMAARARYLTTQAKDDAVEFIHGTVGYNYRLPNVLAAIGCAQLEQLSIRVAAKRAIASTYTQALSAVPGITLMREAADVHSTFWMYTIRIDPALAGRNRTQVLTTLHDHRIQARPLWQPMHLSPAHLGAFALDCSVATRLNEECLSLPCSTGLTAQDQRRVLDVLLPMVSGIAR